MFRKAPACCHCHAAQRQAGHTRRHRFATNAPCGVGSANRAYLAAGVGSVGEHNLRAAHDNNNRGVPMTSAPNRWRSLFACVLLLAGLAATGPAAALGLSEDEAKKLGEKTFHKVVPRKIDYDHLRVKVLPFRASVKDISISESTRFAKHPLRDWEYFYTAKSANLTVELMPLVIGKIYVTDMAVRDFKMNILVGNDYKLNVEDMFQQRKSPLMKWLKVKQLVASNGTVRVVDATASRGPADMTFTDVDATFLDFALKEKFNMLIQLRTPGAATRNVTMRGMAGPIMSADRYEQVPISGNLSVEKAPIMPFMAYAPAGLTAYPDQGLASLKLLLRGNLWDGLSAKGGIQVEQMVLASADGKMKGKPFNMGLEIGEAVVSLKRDAVDIKDVQIALGSSNRFTVSGVIRELFGNPVADVKLANPSIDLAALEVIYPFVRAYLPEGLAYTGTVGIDVQAKGTADATTAKGRLDVSPLGVFLADVFEKKPGTPLAVDFTANLKPRAMKIDALATIAGSDILVLNGRVLREGLRQAFSHTGRPLDSVMRETQTVKAGAVRGSLRYEDGVVHFENFAVQNLRDSEGVLGDLFISGTLDLEQMVVHAQISGSLSEERSQRVRGLQTVTAGGTARLPFRFDVAGRLDNPRVQTVANASAKTGVLQRALTRFGWET
jgi:hypothetical protein